MLALGGLSLYTNGQTSRINQEQSHSLRMQAILTEARSLIALEELYVKRYQVDPRGTLRARYAVAAAGATEALERAGAESRAEEERAGVTRLLGEQATYRRAADKLLDLVAAGDPTSVQVDLTEVQPAFYALQADIDLVAHASSTRAAALVAGHSQAQHRTLFALMIGFLLGLILVGFIWQLVLGYQRRLARQADASEYLALHDPLTGLPNRALFHHRLSEAIAASRTGQSWPALMIVDLNGFKIVNDTLGHHGGDDLLVQTSERLRQVQLGAPHTVGRLGGDEFGVLLEDASGLGNVEAAAEQLRLALHKDFVLPGGSAAISGAIGVALGPSDDVETMMRHADAAMYRAKNTGRGIAVYDPAADAEPRDRLSMFGDLRALLESEDPGGQLMLYFQPLVRISDGSVRSVEALARWEHPIRGLLSPAAFLPVAETGGLEVPLTYHLLRIGVANAARWRDDGEPLIVAVNISPRCLLAPGFVEHVVTTLGEHGLPAALLRLELTENTIIGDPQHAIDVLHKLSAQGIELSLDDFGTGYSALSYLRNLPVHEVKIDRSFVRDIIADIDDAVLVRGAIELAHNLNLRVVAEGVENLSTFAMLREMGCDYAQGFGLSRPVPAESLALACARAARLAGPVSGLATPPQR